MQNKQSEKVVKSKVAAKWWQYNGKNFLAAIHVASSELSTNRSLFKFMPLTQLGYHIRFHNFFHPV